MLIEALFLRIEFSSCAALRQKRQAKEKNQSIDRKQFKKKIVPHSLIYFVFVYYFSWRCYS